MTGAEALALHRRVLGLYERQLELLGADEPDLQALATLSTEIDQALAPLPPPEALEKVDPALRAEILATAERAAAALERVRAALVQRQEKLVRDLAHAAKSADALRAYGALGDLPARYLDQKR
jgi:hypothetical protein